MIPYRVLIVEDEFTIAADIEERLRAMGYDIAGVAINYDEAVELLEKTQIDVALLDINLEDEKSGIDLAEHIREKHFIPIIFLTAYSDNSTFVDASRTAPMAFLNKPFVDEQIDRAIKLAVQRYNDLKAEQKHEVDEISPSSNSLFVKDKGKLNKIEIKNILWLEAMDNYTIIHLVEKRIVANAYLSDLLNRLGNGFMRIHRSHAVSLDKISSVEDNLVYINDIYITISKSYKADFLKRLNTI